MCMSWNKTAVIVTYFVYELRDSQTFLTCKYKQSSLLHYSYFSLHCLYFVFSFHVFQFVVVLGWGCCITFVPKGEELIGDRKNLNNKALNDLYS